MRALFTSLAAAFLAIAPAGASGQTAPAAAPQQQDKAAALAQIIAGPAVLLPVEMGLAKKAFYEGFAAEGDDLIKEFPGLLDHIWAAVEPEYRRMSLARNPAFVATVAAMYRQRLTPKEIDGLQAFFGSPTGRKVLRGHTAVFEGDASQGGGAAEYALGPEDEPALKALMATMEHAKFQAVSAEVQRLTHAHWAIEDPAADARIQALVDAAAKEYMDAQGNGG